MPGDPYTREHDARKRAFRNELICEKFVAGVTVKELAAEFRLSGATVNEIVYEVRQPVLYAVPTPIERLDLTPARIAEMAAAPKEGNAAVYFIQDGEFVKIGATSNGARPDKRLDALQTGNPRELTLRCVIAGDLERAFHNHFRLLRVRGEWFRIDDELEAFMAAVESVAKAA